MWAEVRRAGWAAWSRNRIRPDQANSSNAGEIISARTAIIRMLVFHRSTSALPVHNGSLRGAHFTPACPSKTTSFRFHDDHVVCNTRQERIRHRGPVAGRPAPVPRSCRSDQFYVPEFSELARVVLVVRKRHGFRSLNFSFLTVRRHTSSWPKELRDDSQGYSKHL